MQRGQKDKKSHREGTDKAKEGHRSSTLGKEISSANKEGLKMADSHQSC